MQQQTKFLLQYMLCLILTIVFCYGSLGQTIENIKLLRQKIQFADSVVLISHEVTAEYGSNAPPDWDKRDTSMDLNKWNKLHPPLLKYLEKGKLNRKIINESLVLIDNNKINLSNILLRQVLIKSMNYTKCDQPRHSIIIYNGNKESFIDICFACKRIHTSKDIDFSEFYMDEKKWNELGFFFKTNGLTKLLVELED